MKTLYLECNMGAAGDMILGALLDLTGEQEKYIERLNKLGIPKVRYAFHNGMKCQITGTCVNVFVDGEEEVSEDVNVHIHHQYNEDSEHTHHHHNEDSEHTHHHHNEDGEHTHHHHNEGNEHTHHHTSMEAVENIISSLKLPRRVEKDAKAIYRLIAEAEAKVHNKAISDIHFHEVGTMDAIADIVGVCYMINELNVENIVVSPVHVGYGEVKCAHGILPVPAPATAHILKNVPIYGGSVRGELCTPTGAAILKHFADDFGNMPVMKMEKIGYGMGKKDFEMANCIRAMLGYTEGERDDVIELCVNLDDMTPEKISFVSELLMEEGAKDVYTTSIQMKKNRPAIMLSCMCDQKNKEKLLSIIFKHTTTLGVRECKYKRYILSRTIEERETKYGKVRIKKSTGYGISRQKPEYDDIARIARETGKSLEQVESELNREL